MEEEVELKRSSKVRYEKCRTHAPCFVPPLFTVHISSYFFIVGMEEKKLSNLNDGISQARKSVDRPINFSKDFDL